MGSLSDKQETLITLNPSFTVFMSAQKFSDPTRVTLKGGAIRSFTLPICLLALFSTVASPVTARPFEIIMASNRRATTHQLSSGELTIGVTDYGGGSINQILMPGLSDIMDEQTDRYGRMGQMAVRDSAHGGRYNPTQAGFYETLGTACEITTEPGRLILEPRGLALWHGDGQYDFTEWENIGEDPYRSDGGNTDIDGLDEADLAVVINGVTYTKQEAEVYSEYDFYGTYEDVRGKWGIEIPAIHHYAEVRFIREPGHCVNQHRAGTKLWNAAAVQGDISVDQPAGVFAASDKEMSNPIRAWRLRHDTKIWDPPYRYLALTSGAWTLQSRASGINRDNPFRTALILADSSDPQRGRAIGLYRPETEVNAFPVIGVNETTGEVVYRDARQNLQKVVDDPDVAVGKMSTYGFTSRIRGLIARNRLPADVYESWREEYIMFYGTPQQIMDAIDAYEAPKQTQAISFADLPSVQIGDPDILPVVTAESGLPVTLSSSDPAVARIEEGHIHIVSPGVVSISASQGGSRGFLPAPGVSKVLTVDAVGGSLKVLPIRDRQVHADESISIPIDVVRGVGPPIKLVYRKVSGPAGLDVSEDGQIRWTMLPKVNEATNFEVSVGVTTGTLAEQVETFNIAVWPELKVESEARPDGTSQLSSASIPGRWYQLQSRTDLAYSGWQGMEYQWGTGSTLEFQPPGSSENKFYRVVLMP